MHIYYCILNDPVRYHFNQNELGRLNSENVGFFFCFVFLIRGHFDGGKAAGVSPQYVM